VVLDVFGYMDHRLPGLHYESQAHRWTSDLDSVDLYVEHPPSGTRFRLSVAVEDGVRGGRVEYALGGSA
jgi:hypothetical protein